MSVQNIEKGDQIVAYFVGADYWSRPLFKAEVNYQGKRFTRYYCLLEDLISGQTTEENIQAIIEQANSNPGLIYTKVPRNDPDGEPDCPAANVVLHFVKDGEQ